MNRSNCSTVALSQNSGLTCAPRSAQALQHAGFEQYQRSEKALVPVSVSEQERRLLLCARQRYAERVVQLFTTVKSARGLSAKRSLASRKFAPRIEGLERFVRNEPLRRVHECVFGVLALESEPVDPGL